MNENTQSILLEHYLLALQTNPFTPPPPNLDPELTRMAEKLHAYSRTSAESSAKERVWEDVMTQFDQQNTFSRPIRKEKIPMLATKSFPQQKSSSASWMWIAVASVILLFGVAFAVVGNQHPTPPQFGAGINLSQTQVASPIAPTAPATTVPPTSPVEGYVPVVTVYVPIGYGQIIREDMLIITYWAADRVPSGSYRQIEDVVGMVGITGIPRFLPLLEEVVVSQELAMTGIPYYPEGYGIYVFTPTPMNPDMLPIIATPTPAFTPIPTITPLATHTPTPQP